ncbi:predicted protein [Chaetomium globosum CBS 148.51]|uniref:Uncharacterized protein n=1 Tax=Chaetomium globosum (strain ATCC 6205 / CBS 148.51 / DSM 1962 / NBRC 6347 / NRRL 1970) TaxID=306901 RepID=Q2HBL3_CHAGB|nr:uncharacterized protein CHGG_02391 [Chaetomium globosum CBS 148.51]EAQ90456.1 predicted protein [Chaetomium globosum CBS 148.51]
MASEPKTGGQRLNSAAPISSPIPEIINWPLQKCKMWHGKGHLPPWIEVRRVVSGAIDEGLRTHSLEELVDIVKKPCREAGFKAARNKRDKDAQLEREYHSMVMDFLQRRGLQQSNSSRNAGLSKGVSAGDAKEPTVGTEDPHTDAQEQSYVKVNTPDRPTVDIPQHTGFYANFFNSLFVPSNLQTPVPEADDGLWASEDEWSEVTSQITQGPRRTLGEEKPDDDSEGWVDVKVELDSEEDVAHRWGST